MSNGRTDPDSPRELGKVSQIPGEEHRSLRFYRRGRNESIVCLSSIDSSSRRFP